MTGRVFIGVSVAVQVQIASQCELRCNTWRKVSFEIQTTKSNVSNTRRSVLFDIQTRGRMFYLMSKHRDVIYQTREGVFQLISKHEKSVLFYIPTPRNNISNTRRSVSFNIQTGERVLFYIPTPRSNISNTRRSVSINIQTREGVFYLISKHREEIYQTREGVFHLISKHQEVINQTREGVFIRYSNTEKECLYDRVVKWWRPYHGWRITFASVDFWLVYREFIVSTKNSLLSQKFRVKIWLKFRIFRIFRQNTCQNPSWCALSCLDFLKRLLMPLHLHSYNSLKLRRHLRTETMKLRAKIKE